MLKIHGYAGSINVRKVLWTCVELGLPFERIDWSGGTRPVADPEFLELNPVGMIPVLKDAGQRFWESAHNEKGRLHAALRFVIVMNS
ncbi:glutathione S-transferase N-terminal domain-containing protein [Microvirga flavescens]|uniref:glutathione S-transferase N-terminal domain-containing protein n=1 Tax=Microvirga flavescens TaxID=2249811 RepID=UPI000DD76538|nr:glutathione S-transferase N-terminal domain-containing protein [Microvirga flavescens]